MIAAPAAGEAPSHAAPVALRGAERTSPRAVLAIYAAAAVLACIGLLHSGAFYHDDAFISLRYASRWLAGDGLTWNPAERVEGFTHPLWLAQVAALGALGVDLPTASRLLGVLYLGAIFALWRVASAAPLLLLMLATQAGLLIWSLSGLETASFAFWLALGAWLTQEALWADDGDPRGRKLLASAGAALALAGLTRPEGMGAGVVAMVLLAVHRRRSAWPALASFGLIAGSYEVFRIVYFGDVLPNTAYAKLGGLTLSSRILAGFAYLESTQELWLTSLALTVAAFAVGRGRRPLAMLLIASPVLANVFLAGGDHMPNGRLLVPAVVTVLLAAAIALRAGSSRPRLVAGLTGVMAAVQFATLLLTPIECDPAAATGEHVGRFLQGNLPAGATVATATAGSTPYFAPSLRFIDTLGLNDRHIGRREVRELTTKWQREPGHLKGDGAYVLSRAPDVIILGPAQGFLGETPTEWFLTDYELLKAPAFAAGYQPYEFIVAIPAESIAARPLPLRSDRNPQTRVILYLRGDSAAVERLRGLGRPLPLPAPA